MTVVMDETDTDIIELLDFKFEETCESVLGCDKAAAWALTLLCCEEIFFLCEKCTEDVRKLEGILYNPQCKLCKTVLPRGRIIKRYDRL